jgi:uncharacterized protein Smg (DUF494 family)
MWAKIKFLIFILVSLAALFFYIFYTPVGIRQAYYYLGQGISQKIGLKAEVKSLNFHQYPYIVGELLVEEKYTLTFQGFIEKSRLDVTYKVTSNCLESTVCSIDDIISINGKLNGKFGHFKVTGAGKILDGKIHYDWKKEENTYKNIDLVLQDINSSKLLTLLGQDALFKGKANAHIRFEHIGKNTKKGTIIYDVKDQHLTGLALNLHTQVDIVDDDHTFSIDVTSPELKLNLSKGHYDQALKSAHAFYTLDIRELADLERFIGHKFTGSFYAMGEISYDKELRINGLSKSFGGLIDFLYAQNKLKLDMRDLSVKTLMTRASYTPLLEAETAGEIIYDFSDKGISTKLTLKNIKLLPSEFTDTLSKKSGIDLSQEVFDTSSLDITFKDDIVSGDIKIANKTHHLFLNDTTLDLRRESIATLIDLQTQGHNVTGKTYIRLAGYGTGISYNLQDTYLKFDGSFDTHYHLKLNGLLGDTFINMDYGLQSKRFPGPIVTIEDEIDIQGHLNGPYARLHLQGKGKALDGHIRYEGTKVGEQLENLTLVMDDIRALKLSTLLGYPKLPDGKVDIAADFDYLGMEKRKGKLSYTLRKSIYADLPLTLSSQIRIKDSNQTFNADITLGNAQLKLTEGKYNSETNLSSAFYTLKVKELNAFETLIGFKYKGPFSATGQIDYVDTVEIRGLSKTFGGMMDFLYKKERLTIDLKEVSIKSMMNLFPYTQILDADATGNINYDFKKTLLLVDTNLTNARFLHTDLVDTIYKKSQVNVLHEVFDDSTLTLRYQNDLLLGDLQLENDEGSFSLTNTKINTRKNTINAYFAFDMQEQEFSGKVYGSMDHPKINLDMQKLIQREMDKQLDGIMGKKSRKLMESMPMGGVAKDMATEVGASFMGIFF